MEPPLSSAPPQPIFSVTQAPTQQPSRKPHLASVFFVFSASQTLLGSLALGLEAVALSLVVPVTRGQGIYCGFVLQLSGILGMVASNKGTRGMLTACMISNIITAMVCGIGLGLEIFDATVYPLFANTSIGIVRFGYGKLVFLLIFCAFEMFLTIIQAYCLGRRVCPCSPPPASIVQPNIGPQGMPLFIESVLSMPPYSDEEDAPPPYDDQQFLI